MKTKNELIAKGFIVAGLMNIVGVITFSKFFSNAVIQEFDSEALSKFGLLMIVIWGLAYISIHKSYENAKWIVGVFAIEKLIYAVYWTNWIVNNSLSDVFEKDKMAGIFYAIYGINDWIFFIFFSIVFTRLLRMKEIN